MWFGDKVPLSLIPRTENQNKPFNLITFFFFFAVGVVTQLHLAVWPFITFSLKPEPLNSLSHTFKDNLHPDNDCQLGVEATVKKVEEQGRWTLEKQRMNIYYNM